MKLIFKFTYLSLAIIALPFLFTYVICLFSAFAFNPHTAVFYQPAFQVLNGFYIAFAVVGCGCYTMSLIDQK